MSAVCLHKHNVFASLCTLSHVHRQTSMCMGGDGNLTNHTARVQQCTYKPNSKIVHMQYSSVVVHVVHYIHTCSIVV